MKWKLCIFLQKYQFCERVVFFFLLKQTNPKCFWMNLTSFAHIPRTAAVMKNSHFGPSPPPFSHFRGPQMPEQAHLVRGACLGSRPCLRGEPELMVLKWRPDGDGNLIAAEGASESCPLLLSRYFLLKRPVCSCFILAYYQAAVSPPQSFIQLCSELLYGEFHACGGSNSSFI